MEFYVQSLQDGCVTEQNFKRGFDLSGPYSCMKGKMLLFKKYYMPILMHEAETWTWMTTEMKFFECKRKIQKVDNKKLKKIYRIFKDKQLGKQINKLQM